MTSTPWTAQDVVLIITAIGGLIAGTIGAIAAAIAAVKAGSANEATKDNRTAIQATHEAVNGRMSEALAAARTEAFTAGHAAGFAEALPLQVAPPDGGPAPA